ncbi:MAG: hypothetical protein CMH30_07485 [Micavibrio sp.]|nr:hypothetical protein [Micavibrio sp.]|tara:strand:- start:19 stop:204 length:186 start_codon:yes stop_codon:yes gene_type:complete
MNISGFFKDVAHKWNEAERIAFSIKAANGAQIKANGQIYRAERPARKPSPFLTLSVMLGSK